MLGMSPFPFGSFPSGSTVKVILNLKISEKLNRWGRPLEWSDRKNGVSPDVPGLFVSLLQSAVSPVRVKFHSQLFELSLYEIHSGTMNLQYTINVFDYEVEALKSVCHCVCLSVRLLPIWNLPLTFSQTSTVKFLWAALDKIFKSREYTGNWDLTLIENWSFR